MSLFSNFIEGFGAGVGIVGADYVKQMVPVAERMCLELNWPIKKRLGNDIVLQFYGGVDAEITVGSSGNATLFSSHVATNVPANCVHPQILAHLLIRNSEIASVAWSVVERKNGTVAFCLSYYALSAGLDAPSFQYICELIASELTAFSLKLKAIGM